MPCYIVDCNCSCNSNGWLKPVFVDVNFDQTISLNSFKSAINKKTKALTFVHFKGYRDIFSIIKEAKKIILL